MGIVVALRVGKLFQFIEFILGDDVVDFFPPSLVDLFSFTVGDGGKQFMLVLG